MIRMLELQPGWPGVRPTLMAFTASRSFMYWACFSGRPSTVEQILRSQRAIWRWKRFGREVWLTKVLLASSRWAVMVTVWTWLGSDAGAGCGPPDGDEAGWAEAGATARRPKAPLTLQS